LVTAIILAGGSGSRITTSAIPKQFIQIDGVSILERTLTVFATHGQIDRIIVVVPDSYIDFVNKIVERFGSASIEIISGGPTRQASSTNGVNHIHESSKSDDFVMIHDAARMFVTHDIIDRGLQAMTVNDAATAAIPCQDTMMYASDTGLKGPPLSREGLWIIQTPQVFRLRIIKKAQQETSLTNAGDDASLVLALGMPVIPFLGSSNNVKITTDDDLRWAKVHLAKVAP